VRLLGRGKEVIKMVWLIYTARGNPDCRLGQWDRDLLVEPGWVGTAGRQNQRTGNSVNHGYLLMSNLTLF
jgi:hypothetical protein